MVWQFFVKIKNKKTKYMFNDSLYKYLVLTDFGGECVLT